jgi:hypothetical protein
MLAIFKDGTLINVHVRYWSGGKALTADDLGLKDTEVAEAFKLGKKMLVPDEAIRKFRAKEAQSRRIVEVSSFPFPIGNASFVPKKRVGKVLEALTQYQTDYNTLTDELIRDYDKLRQEMIPVYEEAARTAYAKSLAGKSQPVEFTIESEQADEAAFVKSFMDRINTFYPTVESLRAKFSLYWDVYEIATPSIDKAAIAQTEYQKAMQDRMGTFVTEVVTSLRAKTIEMCSKFAQSLKDGKIIRSTSIDAVRNFIDEYKDLNFIGDVVVEKQLEALRAQLNVEPEAIRESKDLQEALGRKLSEVIDSASEISDISAITGEYKRKVVWDV